MAAPTISERIGRNRKDLRQTYERRLRGVVVRLANCPQHGNDFAFLMAHLIYGSLQFEADDRGSEVVRIKKNVAAALRSEFRLLDLEFAKRIDDVHWAVVQEAAEVQQLTAEERTQEEQDG